MKKGRLIYADEDGTCYVTRRIECDMRPVRSGCGMHIVNSFRYGGFRSLYEFDCFVVRFIQKQRTFPGLRQHGLSVKILRNYLPG